MLSTPTYNILLWLTIHRKWEINLYNRESFYFKHFPVYGTILIKSQTFITNIFMPGLILSLNLTRMIKIKIQR